MGEMDYLKYDETDPLSIEEYAQRLIGLTFQDIEDMYKSSHPTLGESTSNYLDSNRKGGLGNLLEEHYFGYKPNSESMPDFPEAGVELKQTPFEERKDGSLRAGERVVLSMISYSESVESDFFESHFWHKNKLILLVYYLRDRALSNSLLYPIKYAKLFTPPDIDLKIIMNDYRIIIDKIQAGKAHELSESDTLYLGACTKGATAEKSIVNQFYPPHKPAKKRAFCYKQSYMTYVLNEHIAKVPITSDSIIKDASVLRDTSFEDYIASLIHQYIGKTDAELCATFNRPYNKNKAQWTDLTYRMLGIKSNAAAEFIKANVVVKVIRLEKNGKMRESMSFPPFKFSELVKEEWDDSTVYNYFDETRFLFVVFKSDGEHYVLKGCQLWNMPHSDLNTTVKNGWEAVRQIVVNGVIFKQQKTNGGIVIRNNFPKKSDNDIIHIRPHATKRYYKFKDGTVLGNGTISDANQLPDGAWMPNQSFWINNSYILNQLNENLK